MFSVICFGMVKDKELDICLLRRSHCFLKGSSYLLIATKSAISITPFFDPCKPSPLPGGTTYTTKSTTLSISISDYPTPTVSTIMASYPTRSHSLSTSPVFKAIPPRTPLVGLGLTYALSMYASSFILVLSPSIDPPDL